MSLRNGHRFFSLRSKWAPGSVILLTLLVLGSTIFLACRQLRLKLREQIARRDSESLNAVWLSQQDNLDDDAKGFSESAADQFWAILETSRLRQLKGFQAVRLFDAQAKFVAAYPPLAAEGEIAAADLSQLRAAKPVGHFHQNLSETNLWLFSANEASKSGPVFEINLPIHRADSSKLLGVAQFLFRGEGIAAEFAALDQHLFWQGLTAFLAGGGIVVLVLGVAFRQLQKTNELLSERTRSLLQANQELTLAAKTAAIGAVTSHLIHGLKNPLSGLHQFVTSRGQLASESSDSDWHLAVSTTRRMQGLINDVVRVLREENGASQYDLSFEELGEMLSRKIVPLANQAKVDFRAQVTAMGELTNRDANLVLLILENLIHNAIQATPSGKCVTLAIFPDAGKTVCEVCDEGSGLPEPSLKNLFTPCASTKEGGSGIGLSISKQLANYLGADLELRRNSPAGCVFALILASAVTNPRHSAPQSISS